MILLYLFTETGGIAYRQAQDLSTAGYGAGEMASGLSLIMSKSGTEIMILTSDPVRVTTRLDQSGPPLNTGKCLSSPASTIGGTECLVV